MSMPTNLVQQQLNDINDYPTQFRKPFTDALVSKALILNNSNICDEDLTKYIIPFLNANPNITILNISHNFILDATLLAQIKSLLILNIEDNGIGVTVGAFAQNKTLHHLNAAQNHIGDNGAKALAENRTLDTLNLSLNEIGNAGAKALAGNQTFRQLDLSRNCISDARALLQNQTFCQLDLSYNDIDDVSKKILKECTIEYGIKINNYIKTKTAFLSVVTLTNDQNLDIEKQQTLLFKYRAGFQGNDGKIQRFTENTLENILSYLKPKPPRVNFKQ